MLRFPILIVSLLLAGALLAAPSHAAIYEYAKLAPSDVEAGDRFGFAIDVDGTTGIASSRFDDDDGTDSGSAYLFDVRSGVELFKLTASDAAAGDDFGTSVAIDGNRAIIGARGDDDGGTDSGSAYIFDTSTGSQILKLTASDAAASDAFGLSVGISGNRAIVGSYFDDDAGTNSGSAYLFDATTGTQLFKLTASDAGSTDNFGRSVAIGGNYAIVGANLEDDAGSNAGAAYVYDVTTGTQLYKLTSDDAAAGDEFGISVAISGNTAIVGAFRADVSAGDSGAAYLFDLTTGNQLFKLAADDGGLLDWFGLDVDIEGNLAVVGARRDDDNGTDAGAAYFFNALNGAQLLKVTASDGAAGDQFAESVSITERYAFISSNLDDDAGTSSGSAFVFAVPEPASAVFLVLGAIVLSSRQRKPGTASRTVRLKKS